MTRIEQLSRLGHTTATRVLDAFNTDQPRDENGRWGEGSGATKASQTARTPEEHRTVAKMHTEAMNASPKYSHASQMHYLASMAHVQAAQTGKPQDIFKDGHAQNASSELSSFLGGKATPARGTAAQIVEQGGKVNFGKAVSMTKPIETRESIIAQANAWRASRTSGAAAARLRSFKGKKMG
jgi:hypothetical protein